jgi:hypothetical protein
MSKMAELSYEIEQLYIDGHSARSIAMILDCDIRIVLNVLHDWSVADSQQNEEFSPFETVNS